MAVIAVDRCIFDVVLLPPLTRMQISEEDIKAGQRVGEHTGVEGGPRVLLMELDKDSAGENKK